VLIALLLLAFAVADQSLIFTVLYRYQLWCQGDAFHREKESKGPLWREGGWKKLDFLEENMPVSFVRIVLATSSHPHCQA